MNKTLKTILIIVFIGIIAGVITGIYLYNKPARDIAGAKPDYNLTAAELINQYITDQKSSDAKYLDKVILVNGKIAEITNNGNTGMTIVLESQMQGINCAVDTLYFKENRSILLSLSAGNEVKIKGVCSGFDDTFKCVNLDKCTLLD